MISLVLRQASEHGKVDVHLDLDGPGVTVRLDQGNDAMALPAWATLRIGPISNGVELVGERQALLDLLSACVAALDEDPPEDEDEGTVVAIRVEETDEDTYEVFWSKKR